MDDEGSEIAVFIEMEAVVDVDMAVSIRPYLRVVYPIK